MKHLAIMAALFALAACESGGMLFQEQNLGSHSVQVVNGRNSPIIKFRASATHDRSWGSDRLGNATINPGQSRTFIFENIPSCSYDFNIEFLDDMTIDRRRVDICATTRWVAN